MKKKSEKVTHSTYCEHSKSPSLSMLLSRLNDARTSFFNTFFALKTL